ncbi:MAG: hypothetical protein GXO49_00550 [Chlorobi bacterium]|nr:hypothetical protein [Chlorobiota bacterium]
METSLLDQALLLLTGLIAVYLIYRFLQAYKEQSDNNRHFIPLITAFAVLFVSGVLVILFDFDVLSRPEIKIVATLIPFGIAIGLMCEFYKKYATYYKIFLLIGFILIVLLNYGVITTKLVYPIFHSVAGFTIFIVPILAIKDKMADKSFIGVTIGGTIIGIGGMALAFLGAGKPLFGIFTAQVVFAILTTILLTMTLGFTYGYVKHIKK